MLKEVGNLSFNSRAENSLELTVQNFEIRHYSYNLPLDTIQQSGTSSQNSS